jgi:hypothetical protein
MTQTAEKLLSEALALNEAERAELAARLLETLDPSTDIDYVAAWESELQERIRQLDSGEVRAIPWTEARRMIREGGGDR